MAAGAHPAPARADDTALDVTVNGVPVSVEAALGAAPYDETAKGFTECYPSGASNTVILTGWSVATLIAAAGTTPSNVTSVSVARDGSEAGSVVLTPADYDPSASGYPTFSEGPALVMPRRDGGSLATRYTFFRPYRGSSCASDPNGGDYVQTPLGGTLSIALSAGTKLSVSSTQDRTQTSTTMPVTYSGSVANPPDGENLTYRWTFSDGSVAMGQSVTHTYTAAGTYTATLSVSSGAAAGGEASPLSVTVGSATGPTPAPGGGTGKTAEPTARPSVPASPRANATPQHSRPATPSPRRSSTPSSLVPTEPTAPTALTVSTAPTAPGAVATTPATTPATMPATTAAATTASAAAIPAAAIPARAPVAAAAGEPVAGEPVAGEPVAGQLVTGLLVAGLSRQAPLPSATVVRSSVAPQPAAGDTGSTTSEHGVALGAAGTGLGTIVLLGVGAALELRRGRR